MQIKIATIGDSGTNWASTNTCHDCGQIVVPGEHSGHRGHFTGAWICHDCGPLCVGFEED